MKVLVTGGQGFIGSHVVRKLLEHGHRVVSFDRYFKKWVPDIENFIGDVRDEKAIDQAVYTTDAVIHLAGILGTAETLQHIKETIDININGTIGIFEAIRKYNRRCVYITLPDVWQNPYSITKRAVKDFALYVYNKELGTEIQVVRGFNVYGEGQKYKPVRKFAPSFIIRALLGEKLQVFGDGSQLVDLVYAGDTAEILIRAMEADKVADEVIDAGSGEGVPIIEVAKIISKMTGADIEHLPMRKGETSKAIIRGDVSTLERWLGKYEFISLEEGMTRTVNWYKEHYKELI
ncbi:MAG TPA: SDR family NAD(P)-dependent oxidoreductase [Candidatus Paceibacterota bacterium]